MAAETKATGSGATSVHRHTAFEDIHALFMGTLFIGIGFILLQSAKLITGGAAGIALILHYLTGYSTGTVFFVINIPFYIFAYKAMGRAFTLKTFATNILLVAWNAFLPHVLAVSLPTPGLLAPTFAAIAGGTLLGMGILALARHKASVGGTGVLTLYLQDKRGWRAGRVQMAFDCVIVSSAAFFLSFDKLLLSILSAVAMSAVLIINHKPGRYTGY